MTTLCPSNELYVPCFYYISSLNGVQQKPAAEEEDIDLFGDDGDEASEDLKKLAAKKKEETSKNKKKKEVINKSMLVIEVKPNDADTNLNDIEEEIRKIKIEGVAWGENSKKVPIAFGLYKLQVQCVIIDDLVDTEEILDKIEEIGMTEEDKKKREEKLQTGEEDDDEQLSGLVQSAQIVSFNKL